MKIGSLVQILVFSRATCSASLQSHPCHAPTRTRPFSPKGTQPDFDRIVLKGPQAVFKTPQHDERQIQSVTTGHFVSEPTPGPVHRDQLMTPLAMATSTMTVPASNIYAAPASRLAKNTVVSTSGVGSTTSETATKMQVVHVIIVKQKMPPTVAAKASSPVKTRFDADFLLTAAQPSHFVSQQATGRTSRAKPGCARSKHNHASKTVMPHAVARTTMKIEL